MEITILELLKLGFFLGVGWWSAKVIFIVAITRYLGESITLSKDED